MMPHFMNLTQDKQAEIKPHTHTHTHIQHTHKHNTRTHTHTTHTHTQHNTHTTHTHHTHTHTCTKKEPTQKPTAGKDELVVLEAVSTSDIKGALGGSRVNRVKNDVLQCETKRVPAHFSLVHTRTHTQRHTPPRWPCG